MTTKINKSSILAEALRLLKEVGPQPTPAAPLQAPAAPPAQPAAPAAPPVDPANPATPMPTTTSQTVENLVEAIDNVRAGRSLSEPSAYQALSEWYETLQPQEQATIQTAMAKLAEILTPQQNNDPTQDQANNSRTAQQAPPAPAPVPGAQQAAAPAAQPAAI